MVKELELYELYNIIVQNFDFSTRTDRILKKPNLFFIKKLKNETLFWTWSSVGRALAWRSKGPWFDP